MTSLRLYGSRVSTHSMTGSCGFFSRALMKRSLAFFALSSSGENAHASGTQGNNALTRAAWPRRGCSHIYVCVPTHLARIGS